MRGEHMYGSECVHTCLCLSMQNERHAACTGVFARDCRSRSDYGIGMIDCCGAVHCTHADGCMCKNLAMRLLCGM
jgi:hypothetical protein